MKNRCNMIYFTDKFRWLIGKNDPISYNYHHYQAELL